RSEISLQIEQPIERWKCASRIGYLRALVVVHHRHVADVSRATGIARHPPTTPTLIERTAVHRREAVGVRVLVLQRIHALHHHAGYAKRLPREMTRKAVVVPLQYRLRSSILREVVEDDALLWILRGHFDHLRAADVANGNGVGEEHGARVLHPDLRRLETG